MLSFLFEEGADVVVDVVIRLSDVLSILEVVPGVVVGTLEEEDMEVDDGKMVLISHDVPFSHPTLAGGRMETTSPSAAVLFTSCDVMMGEHIGTLIVLLNVDVVVTVEVVIAFEVDDVVAMLFSISSQYFSNRVRSMSSPRLKGSKGCKGRCGAVGVRSAIGTGIGVVEYLFCGEYNGWFSADVGTVYAEVLDVNSVAGEEVAGEDFDDEDDWFFTYLNLKWSAWVAVQGTWISKVPFLLGSSLLAIGVLEFK